MRDLRSLSRREIDLGLGAPLQYYAVPSLAEHGIGRVARLPIVLRVVLESVLRCCDGRKVLPEHAEALANWQPNAVRYTEIPFTVGRVVLNCAAGIPLLGDLTAMRGAVTRYGRPATLVGPKVPVDMALDHTLTVDYHGSPDALRLNTELDIQRNEERYRFVKWAMQAYGGIRLFPPGAGILHQLNLEVLAPGILIKDGLCYPDTLVGTDSHTCMISGLGAVGWGVGGIEAQGAVLGHPVCFLTPDVVGVHITNRLPAGTTSTDLVLHVTELLRRAKVVGKFVEFFGEGVATLSVPDRATIANMAVEYGATIGYFAVDEQTCQYLRQTGRSEQKVRAVERYYRAQGCFGAPHAGDVDYSDLIPLDLKSIVPSLAGPKRPQDRVPLDRMKTRFAEALAEPVSAGGYGKSASSGGVAATADAGAKHVPRDGDVVIAAITSCTNTSNPGVMLAAGLLARKAVEKGLATKPWVKTSLAPGSMVVSRYLEATGLQRPLDALGFAIVGYSCTTCVGASGPIDADLETAITEGDVVACAVLSGNRNFEARIHPAVRAAFLASPPLVVAYALAGHVGIDLTREPIGTDTGGRPVFLRDIWPSAEELEGAYRVASDPAFYHAVYDHDVAAADPHWAKIPQTSGSLYPWDENSAYLKEPPFLAPEFCESPLHDICGARALAILGDSVTTDHISPIGNIKSASPAGAYLIDLKVAPRDFNNFGARRMNHEVMVRGAFSNVRLRNLMVPGVEGGVTAFQPGGESISIYEASLRYRAQGVPLVVIAGQDYGTGSARDWAAKATRLLGVRAVIAGSFERIHRSNLVGMGVLPCQFADGVKASDLALDGSERFDILGLSAAASTRQMLRLQIHRADGSVSEAPLVLRLDTPAELDYVRRGGMMPFILSELLKEEPAAA